MGGLYYTTNVVWIVDKDDYFLSLEYYQFTNGSSKFDAGSTDKLIGPVGLVKWEE